MPTSASVSSIRRCTSPTVLRGTIRPGMPVAPSGDFPIRIGEPVAVGCDATDDLLLAPAGREEIDAVEVIARRLLGDRKLRDARTPSWTFSEARERERVGRLVGGVPKRANLSIRRRAQREAQSPAAGDPEKRAVFILLPAQLRATVPFFGSLEARPEQQMHSSLSYSAPASPLHREQAP